MWTSLANQLICENAIEQVFHHSLFLGPLYHAFDSINKHVEELIHVFLNSWIDWTTINIIESLAELLRVVVLLLKLHQSAENTFNLVEGVFRFGLDIHVFVLDLQHSLPEWSYHVELLNYAVHVADTSYVFQTYIPSY